MVFYPTVWPARTVPSPGFHSFLTFEPETKLLAQCYWRRIWLSEMLGRREELFKSIKDSPVAFQYSTPPKSSGDRQKKCEGQD
ncbi:hypothetical protein RRG08_038933 [Elysia crispata]|uniref:Uncharacterized protein n=1 Tax=Elysia crispata TaxID=231223 RepID=A0AAE0Y7R1_9GAST|nr:hypothetical protein RRG08_038933 [Elysia crispata]